MKKGDLMQCELLTKSGEPTGNRVDVKVCEVKRNHVTQEVQSVRVKAIGRDKWVWVQPQYLTAQP